MSSSKNRDKEDSFSKLFCCLPIILSFDISLIEHAENRTVMFLCSLI